MWLILLMVQVLLHQLKGIPLHLILTNQILQHLLLVLFLPITMVIILLPQQVLQMQLMARSGELQQLVLVAELA